MKTPRRIILSCEHASNRVPARHRKLFTKAPNILNTHRGYDIGIASVARQMQKRLSCPLCRYEWTRLLIDVNRTKKRALFSEYSASLDELEKQHILRQYYQPYQKQLARTIEQTIESSPILHLSLHSFTPKLKGTARNADIGILYDPARKMEKQFAERLTYHLKQQSALRIRRNYPYRGNADGMTTGHRRIYKQTLYLGIEIELNQAMLLSLNRLAHTKLVTLLVDTIQLALVK